MNRGGTLVRPVRLTGAVLLPALFLFLWACTPAQPPHYTVFAMEGPPLAIAGGRLGDAGEPRLFGRMERSGMVGNGEIEFEYPPAHRVCQGRLTGGPAENGRVRGIIPCVSTVDQDTSVFLLLTLGQHGPDQGVGVARFTRGQAADVGSGAEPVQIKDLEIFDEPPLIFFYHPWDEEARRRYLEARENVLRSLEKKERRAD